MTSPRLDLGTLCVLDTCDNQLHHEAIYMWLSQIASSDYVRVAQSMLHCCGKRLWRALRPPDTGGAGQKARRSTALQNAAP
jgi:hypothetical protein